jgi:predicted dehydrogenase
MASWRWIRTRLTEILVSKVKFAIVGCGKIAARHFQALASLPNDAQLVAVCDLSAERAAAAASKQNVPGYTSIAEMMSKHPDIDVVDVLVPTGHHASVITQLAPYGKTLVTEKPMTLRAEDARAMVAACEAGKSKLYVIYQNRYNGMISAAHRALEAGHIGKPVMVTVRVRWKRDQQYYASDAWRGTWAYDGGVVAQQASHHLDLLQWFFGPVTSVTCASATRLLNIEVEDTAAAVLRFANGAIGVFEATVAARPADAEGSLSVLGEKGTIVIGGVNLNELSTWKLAGEPADAPAPVGAQTGNDKGQLHAAFFTDVITAIRTGKAPAWLVDGREGLRNVELLAALYESAASNGTPVAPGSPQVHSLLGVKPAAV